VRFDDFRKRKDAVYARLEGTRLEVIENILLSLGPQLRDRKYFAECVSANGQPFAQCGKQGKRCWLERKRSVFEDSLSDGFYSRISSLSCTKSRTSAPRLEHPTKFIADRCAAGGPAALR
jgi:hypothetical protein